MVDGLVAYRTNELLDEDGRPLGEISSPLWDPAATEVVACPYADGRRGQPMNRTALRQMSGVWPEVLAVVRTLAGPAPTLHRAWQVALVGVSAPLALPSPTPLLWSALYKACLGLSQITTHLLLAAEGTADLPFGGLGDGEALFDALDRGRWLLGQVQVCAGTRAMIAQVGDALAGVPGPTAVLPPALDGLGWLAACTVGLEAARALRIQQDRREGSDRASLPAAPWLRTVTSVPGRPASEVRRLFPAGRCPDEIEAVIEAADWESAYALGLEGIGR